MFYSWLKSGLLVVVSVGAFHGCGPSAVRPRAGKMPPGVTAPPELQGARLLYQRPDGIYLRILGQDQSSRLVADGAYPRWAPDGRSFAFVRGSLILHFDLENQAEHVVAEAGQPRAIAFHPDGERILFTDGKSVKSVALRGGEATTVATGPEFLELDVSRQGDFFAATVKSFGYRVWRLDLPSGKPVEIGRGCSASISPDGRLVTINSGSHEQLALMDSQTGQERGLLPAPAGLQLDNQKWSNHPEWIAAVSEGQRRDILVQRVRDYQAWRVTDDGDADRPDLFVE